MRVQGVADSDMSKSARGVRRDTPVVFAFLVLESLNVASFLNFFKVGHAETNVHNSREFLGKRCEKNYSSVRRYVADPVNAYPKQSITKLILKGAVIFDVVSYQFRCALNYSKLVRKL
ncbi:hypothetical protein Tco_0348784 [Tanacetum coccineum]